jgi:hypothetical protein
VAGSDHCFSKCAEERRGAIFSPLARVALVGDRIATVMPKIQLLTDIAYFYFSINCNLFQHYFQIRARGAVTASGTELDRRSARPSCHASILDIDSQNGWGASACPKIWDAVGATHAALAHTTSRSRATGVWRLARQRISQ